MNKVLIIFWGRYITAHTTSCGGSNSKTFSSKLEYWALLSVEFFQGSNNGPQHGVCRFQGAPHYEGESSSSLVERCVFYVCGKQVSPTEVEVEESSFHHNHDVISFIGQANAEE